MVEDFFNNRGRAEDEALFLANRQVNAVERQLEVTAAAALENNARLDAVIGRLESLERAVREYVA